jgi:hypothetical protein
MEKGSHFSNDFACTCRLWLFQKTGCVYYVFSTSGFRLLCKSRVSKSVI